jgi:hypothetical protein
MWLAALEFGAADEVLVAQARIALEIGRREIAVGLRRGHLGARRVGCQPVVLRIELGQHLAGLERWPSSAWRLVILPGHAESQPRFDTRPDLGRELGLCVEIAGAHSHELDRAHRLFGWLGLRTAGQEQGGKQ